MWCLWHILQGASGDDPAQLAEQPLFGTPGEAVVVITTLAVCAWHSAVEIEGLEHVVVGAVVPVDADAACCRIVRGLSVATFHSSPFGSVLDGVSLSVGRMERGRILRAQISLQDEKPTHQTGTLTSHPAHSACLSKDFGAMKLYKVCILYYILIYFSMLLKSKERRSALCLNMCE
jgi:hypothetical protein